MKRITSFMLVVVAIASFACSEPNSESASPEPVPEASGDDSPLPEETTEASPSPEEANECSGRQPQSPEPNAVTKRLVISAKANIYGSGRANAPSPGGGGGGILPPVWRLPNGKDRVVAFPSVTGRVTPIDSGFTNSTRYNGPEGTASYHTYVASFGGISGIDHLECQMFLVGVFLTEAPPKGPAPPRLDFTDPLPTDVVAPKIGQVFFIGDGTYYRYAVPPQATRLFLGFADGYLGSGLPGYYVNNSGNLKATFSLTQG